MIERALAIHSTHLWGVGGLVWWSMSNCQAYLAMVDPFHHVDAYVRDVKESPGLIPHVTLFKTLLTSMQHFIARMDALPGHT